jgi:hypothetical protein
VQPVAVEEEGLPVGQHEAEVVADAFVQIQAHREAEGRCEVHPHRRDLQVIHRSHASIIVSAVRNTLLAFLTALLLCACSKVTQENFLKIQDGMSEQEVIALLGQPTESNSVTLLGMSGTSSRWVQGDAVISVNFVNGKVALKSFDKGPQGKAQGK